VGNDGTKTSTRSGSKGIGSSSSEEKGTSDSGHYNSSNNSSGETSNQTNRESTSTCFTNITTSLVGLIASRYGTVVGGGANNIKLEAPSVSVTSDVKTDVIGLIADHSGIVARIGKVLGQGVAHVNSTSIVVVTQIDRDRVVLTAGGHIT